MQNQSKNAITFDTQMKTALMIDVFFCQLQRRTRIVKKYCVISTEVEPMTFRLPVRYSTTELLETCGS